MKPLRLRARGLRTFPDLDLELGQGVVGILGEIRDGSDSIDSNGAGKSTILEAIDIALFGRRSLAGYLTRGGDVGELMIELTFEHGGETYRVRRTFSAKSRGKTSVDLERCVWADDDIEHATESRWEPLTRASARETDEFLADLIGLSKETFRDGAYLRQGDGGYADPNRDPRQRKQLLVEAVLGRDPIWPKLADIAKLRRVGNQAQIERNRGETDRLTEQASSEETVRESLAAAEQAVVTAQTAVSQAEERHTAATARYQAAREQAAARATIEAELKAARTERDRLNALELSATEAVAAKQAAREELDTLTTSVQILDLESRERALVARIEEYRAAAALFERAQRDHATAVERKREAIARAEQKERFADEVEAKADALAQEEHPHCQTCGQEVDGAARVRAIDAHRDEAALHRAAAARERAEADLVVIPELPVAPILPIEADRDLPAVRAQLEKARAAAAQRARLEERLAQLDTTIAARPTTEQLLAAGDTVTVKERILAELEPVDLDTLTLEGEQARAQLDLARTTHMSAAEVKARMGERLTAIEAAKTRLAEIEASTRDLQAQIDRDVLLEKAYGRDGIPALIIENTAIPAIEAEASRILRALGTSFDVQLRTQAENKSGTLRDTLDVVVIDQDGNEADYADGCSGGEQTRIGLALRIALARLLAHRRGAESRLLALDEPSYLDAAGMTALLDVLRGLDSEFDLILLVSHVAELRDALDETITVVKEGGVSRLAGDREPVGVAA